MIRICLAACVAGALFAAPAVAQDQGAGEQEERNIVVTGERPTWFETTRQARSITALTGLRYLPLPRFSGDRLCPGIFGLKPEYAAVMIDRIRASADRLGVWLAPDDGSCSPNLVVAFVDDGQAALRHYAAQQPWLFADMPRHERIELLREEGPARVWTSTHIRTRDGMPLSEDRANNIQVAQTWMAHSRIYTATRADITGALVLFDRAEVRGKTLLQLADYATMRGLARTKSPEGRDAGLGTILGLFDEGVAPPPELTQFDRAYLAALYSDIPNLPGLTKVNSVNRQLHRQLDALEAAAGE